MKPYLFWVLFVIMILQQMTIRHLQNTLESHWSETLDNKVQILELRKDLDATIYAIGTE